MSDPSAFSPWLERSDELRRSFREASPFPLVVIDGFLDDGLAHDLVREFPDVDEMPRSRDYVFGAKHELSSVGERGPASARFHAGVLSPRFAAFLGELSGEPVFVDPDFHGGGFHQGANGSFLDLHVDFNLHPGHPDWLRTLNVLVYLNPGWRREYGGELLVTSSPTSPPREIEPLFNRAVIMRTDDRTYHGYRRMTLPPGVTRRSLAAYAYRAVEPGAIRPRTTGWAPEDAGPAKRFLARHYDTLVQVKNRWLGSGTARNR